MEQLTPRRLIPLAVKQRRRPYIYWYLSLRCNLACKHCWVNSSPHVDTSSDLTEPEMIDAIANMARLGPAGVLLTGGEPLFHPSIETLLTLLAENRISISIETNAMLVTSRILDIAAKIRDSGGEITFSVSLDGGNAQSHDWCRGKGSFTQTVAGLRRLTDAGMTTEVQCVINRRNWASLGELVEFANTLSLRYLKFVLTNPVGRATRFTEKLMIPFSETHDALQVLADALDRYRGNVIIKVPPAMIQPSLQSRMRHYVSSTGCTVSNITSCSFPLLGVLPDGSITLCAESRGIEDAYFGDIRTVSLSDMWETEHFVDMRRQYVDASLTGICADCVFKKECLGACRAHALSESGSVEAPYPICADMDRAGYFPDAYRISKLAALGDRARELASLGHG